VARPTQAAYIRPCRTGAAAEVSHSGRGRRKPRPESGCQAQCHTFRCCFMPAGSARTGDCYERTGHGQAAVARQCSRARHALRELAPNRRRRPNVEIDVAPAIPQSTEAPTTAASLPAVTAQRLHCLPGRRQHRQPCGRRAAVRSGQRSVYPLPRLVRLDPAVGV